MQGGAQFICWGVEFLNFISKYSVYIYVFLSLYSIYIHTIQFGVLNFDHPKKRVPLPWHGGRFGLYCHLPCWTGLLSQERERWLDETYFFVGKCSEWPFFPKFLWFNSSKKVQHQWGGIIPVVDDGWMKWP